VPADRLCQDATGQQSDRAAAGDDEGVDAHRDRSLPRLRELGHDQREDHRRGDRAAEPLDEARGDQHDLVAGNPASRRGEREQHEAAEKDALAPDQVAEPAREQQEAAERDHVRVDDPGQVRLREVQVALDRRQRDVHNRRVEDHHQLAQADDRERYPAAPIGV
jgi:hypothetical protein